MRNFSLFDKASISVSVPWPFFYISKTYVITSTSEAKHEAFDRERILKKLDALISEREKREQKK